MTEEKLEIVDISGASDADQINATAKSMMQMMDPSNPHLNLASLAKLMALNLIVLQMEPHNLSRPQADSIQKAYNKAIKKYLDNPAGAIKSLKGTKAN